MYGLINRALQEMIMDQFGEETWNEILAIAQVPDSSFLTMQKNDDAVTFDLVGATSTVLDLEADDCLFAFGSYWVLHTATDYYENLMQSSGQTLVEFLENLNNLHDRITTTFIEYLPPSFRMHRLSGELYELHYQSHRVGLQGFVEGLLAGLAERFDTPLEILNISDKGAERGSHLVFSIAIGSHE